MTSITHLSVCICLLAATCLAIRAEQDRFVRLYREIIQCIAEAPDGGCPYAEAGARARSAAGAARRRGETR